MSSYRSENLRPSYLPAWIFWWHFLQVGICLRLSWFITWRKPSTFPTLMCRMWWYSILLVEPHAQCRFNLNLVRQLYLITGTWSSVKEGGFKPQLKDSIADVIISFERGQSISLISVSLLIIVTYESLTIFFVSTLYLIKGDFPNFFMIFEMDVL